MFNAALKAKAQRGVTVFLSLLLTASLVNLTAFAGGSNTFDSTSFDTNPADVTAQVATSEAGSSADVATTDKDVSVNDLDGEVITIGDVSVDDTGDFDTALNDVPAESTTENTSETVSGADVTVEDKAIEEDPVELMGEDGTTVTRLAAESLGYVYVDEAVVTPGTTQNVVVALSDEAQTIDAATLNLVAPNESTMINVASSKIADSAVLFEISTQQLSDYGRYWLGSLEFTSNGAHYVLDLGTASLSAIDVVKGEALSTIDAAPETTTTDVTNVDLPEGDSAAAVYGFNYAEEEVVNEVAEALANTDGNDAVLAFDGEDELTVTDSVGEALESINATSENEEVNDTKTFTLNDLIGVQKAYAKANGKLVVAIDPGHGYTDSGAVYGTLLEKNINLSIAKYFRNELNTYSGVTTYMTREDDKSNPGLTERVKKAYAAGADVFVSVHINSAVAANALGAEVWVPNESSYLKAATHDVGESLGNKILAQLTSLGLKNRGIKMSNTQNNSKYADGSLADYYTVIAECRKLGIPGIIVEHGFITNANDRVNYFSSEAQLKKLGVADATGVAQQYGLKKGSSTTTTATTTNKVTKTASITYRAHVQKKGWMSTVGSGKTAGTTGKKLRLEALRIYLNNAEYTGGLQVRAHVQKKGWMAWKSSGALVGTTGQSLRLEALQIKLTGNMAKNYDIYYRAHVQNIGWQGWVKNGATAGTTGKKLRIEAVQIKLVKKSTTTTVSTTTTSSSSVLTGNYVNYASYVQGSGWQAQKTDGTTSGTTGQSKRIEAFKLSLGTAGGYSGGISYRSRAQGSSWESTWKTNGAISGTAGSGKYLEALQIKLTGNMANQYDVYYRVHVQKLGWMGWAKNGDIVGTYGLGYRIEALQVKLVKKNASAPGSTANAYQAVTASIMSSSGTTEATQAQMVSYYKASGKTYPSSTYSKLGASTIEQFVQILCEEAKTEGVRADVAFCQAMKETGWLQFGGDVKAEQCNFAGLGATGGGAAGATFTDVRTGLRAQIQHLKAYASTSKLIQDTVDPRFNLVTRGCAPTLADLSGKWAVPGYNYGEDINDMLTACLKK